MALGTEIIFLIILIVFSGIFSGAEVALISLTDAKVKGLVKKKKSGARYVQLLKERPQRMLSAILIGNNIANIAAASIMTVVMIDIFGNYAVGIATGVMTLLILIFGEITPKSIAARHSERVACLISPPLWFLSVFLRPILYVLDGFLNAFLKLFKLDTHQSVITEDEIKHMVSAAEEEGSIKEIEKRLINNVFEFDEKYVSEIITPRTDMVMISVGATVKEALAIVSEKKHSRMPVYNKQKDHIVGVLALRDLLGMKETALVRSVMHKPYFIPETKPVSDLLRNFQNRKEHLALVVDEHGATTGLVTLEDVLEEIVGEIVDESEPDEDNIKSLGSKKWNVNGKTVIEEANKRLKMKIPKGDYETLSGFILDKLGHIPSEGEEIAHGKFTIQVLQVQNQRIARVLVKK